MGSGNILWKFDLDQIIFLDFTGIENLKIQRNKSEWCKSFLGVYFTLKGLRVSESIQVSNEGYMVERLDKFWDMTVMTSVQCHDGLGSSSTNKQNINYIQERKDQRNQQTS